mmetsp:Transcript_4012/g.5564  ORF Transcript_4012/g.5564 Transcript_4012/m.5564 type:complete len:207 (-) Transcript_4012:97-717(-)
MSSAYRRIVNETNAEWLERLILIDAPADIRSNVQQLLASEQYIQEGDKAQQGLHLTATPITPSELVDVDLGHLAFAEAYTHNSEYYLDLWNNVLTNQGLFSIVYNRAAGLAKLVRSEDNRKLLTIPCQHPRQVKGYYIAFRMLQDDVQALLDFLRGTDAKELSDLAANETPPANMYYQTELAAVIDRFAKARVQRSRRQKQCCVVM